MPATTPHLTAQLEILRAAHSELLPLVEFTQQAIGQVALNCYRALHQLPAAPGYPLSTIAPDAPHHYGILPASYVRRAVRLPQNRPLLPHLPHLRLGHAMTETYASRLGGFHVWPTSRFVTIDLLSVAATTGIRKSTCSLSTDGNVAFNYSSLLTFPQRFIQPGASRSRHSSAAELQHEYATSFGHALDLSQVTALCLHVAYDISSDLTAIRAARAIWNDWLQISV
jgi:hypothetical protein